MNVNKSISSIDRKFTQIFTLLVETARLYAAIRTASPEADTRLRELHPEIPREMWSRLFAVGNGSLLPELLWASATIAGRMARLTPEQQREALDIGIPTITVDDELQLKPHQLTRYQLDQVFASDHLRDVEEQQAWVESNKMKHASVLARWAKNQYEIVDGRLVIYGPTLSGNRTIVAVFTVKQVKEILNKMRKPKKG